MTLPREQRICASKYKGHGSHFIINTKLQSQSEITRTEKALHNPYCFGLHLDLREGYIFDYLHTLCMIIEKISQKKIKVLRLYGVPVKQAEFILKKLSPLIVIEISDSIETICALIPGEMLPKMVTSLTIIGTRSRNVESMVIGKGGLNWANPRISQTIGTLHFLKYLMIDGLAKFDMGKTFSLDVTPYKWISIKSLANIYRQICQSLFNLKTHLHLNILRLVNVPLPISTKIDFKFKVESLNCIESSPLTKRWTGFNINKLEANFTDKISKVPITASATSFATKTVGGTSQMTKKLVAEELNWQYIQTDDMDVLSPNVFSSNVKMFKYKINPDITLMNMDIPETLPELQGTLF